MTITADTRPSPDARLMGSPTARRRLLLDRIDVIVERELHARRPHFTGWMVYAVLPDVTARRRAGQVVALRAEPMPGVTLADAQPFPWQHLGPIASRIAAACWEVTAVVPDVAVEPPALERSGLAEAFDEPGCEQDRLSA